MSESRANKTNPQIHRTTDYTFKITEDWQARCVSEFLELRERVFKLKEALDDRDAMSLVTREEKQLLWGQWEVMEQYSDILIERLTVNRVLIDPTWIEE